MLVKKSSGFTKPTQKSDNISAMEQHMHGPMHKSVYSGKLAIKGPSMAAGDIINMNGDFLKAGFQAVRVMDPTNQTITTVGYTDRGRWYPTVMTLADGNILVVGGVQMVSAADAAADAAASTAAVAAAAVLTIG